MGPWRQTVGALVVLVAAIATAGGARGQQPAPAIPPAEEAKPQPPRKPSDPYRPGPDVELPTVIKQPRPNYTADAKARGIEGTVWVEVVVGTDGKVRDPRVTKSLDHVYGLDQEAVKTVRKWRFAPGRRLGKPVPVLVTIELTFTLK